MIIQKLLKDHLTGLQTEIDSLINKKNKIDDDILVLSNEYRNTQKELQDTCLHPEVKRISVYTGGGYDYTSTTHYTTVCTNCEKILSTKIVKGSYE